MAALLTTTSLASVMIAACGSVQAQTIGRQTNFNIPAGPLSRALASFGQQAGIQVTYLPAIAVGKSSPGVAGAVSPSEALARLLQESGLSYRFTNASTVAISAPGGESIATPAVDGAIPLDEINVTGAQGGSSRADKPFSTPGSTSYISREQLDRVPPISAGDVFISTPGVISAGNRVGTSINPNIRGLQGMGRNNVTVDGARQTTSSYRGYIGNRDETYIDPDMIGGIDISKGPSESVGTGTIGGTINFRTLEAQDIVASGKDFGIRLKGGLGNNSAAADAPNFIARSPLNMIGDDRSSWFNGETYSGSAAIATMKENYEFVLAYSKRVQGNYFVGTKVPDGLVFSPAANSNTFIKPGTEAFNTSENTDSVLAKGKVKWGDGHSLELGYLSYRSNYGEVDELSMSFASQSGLLPYGQYPFSETQVSTYTAKYKFEPSNNPLVNLRANLWLSDLDSYRKYGGLPQGVRTTGGDVGNTSVFTTPLGELTWDNGVEFTNEHAQAEQFASLVTYSEGWETLGPSGARLMTGAFSKASLKLTQWLTLSAGGRYDHYESKGEGYLDKFPEQSGGRFSPNAGVTITPWEGVQLYGLYKEGYRPPSLRESHWHYQGLLWNNPDLRPEVAKNGEVGLNVLRENVFKKDDKFRFKLSFFDNNYDNYIVRMRSDGTTPGLDPSRYNWFNLDTARYRGFEISGGYDAGTAFVEGVFTKYTDIEYCRTEGVCAPPGASNTLSGAGGALVNDWAANYVPPEYSGSVTAGVRLFDQKLTLGGRTHFAGARSGSVWPPSSQGLIGASFTWPSYRVYDFFGSYKFNEDNILHVSIENITDEYYFGALVSTGIPSPGRTARISYTTKFGDPKPVFPKIRLGNAAVGAPGSDWTGVYVGGHLGYGFSHVTGTTTTAAGLAGGVPATESANFKTDDFVQGFQSGFNYQLANGIVLGVEGDISWLNVEKKQTALAEEGGQLAANGFLQAKTRYEFDWMATIRGRLGYAFDRTLVYGTGGLAFLHETQTRSQYQSDVANTTVPYGRGTTEIFKEQAEATRRGWTLGSGFEYALNNNWALKGEYSYAHFGDEDFLFPKATAGVTRPYTVQTTCRLFVGGVCRAWNTETVPGSSQTTNGRKASSSLDLHAIKIGLNYRF